MCNLCVCRRKDDYDGGGVHVAGRLETHIRTAARVLAHGRAVGERDSQLRLRHPRPDEHVGHAHAPTADQPDQPPEEHARGREESLEEARAHSGSPLFHQLQSPSSSLIDAGISIVSNH